MSLQSVLAQFTAQAQAEGLSEGDWFVKAVAERDAATLELLRAEAQLQGDTALESTLAQMKADAIADEAAIGNVAGKQDTSEKGQPNGYAALDGTGKVPSAQLPFSAMEFKGSWNASTNSPSLADGVGNQGDFYRVSTSGTQNLGSGSTTYLVGDSLIYSGTVWERYSDAQSAVTPNVRYVSKGGDDTLGDGSLLRPFLTIKACLDSITTASDSNRFTVLIGPGLFTEAVGFALKDHISLIGAGRSRTRIAMADSSAIVLNASAGYIIGTNGFPHITIRDITFVHPFRCTRPSSGVTKTEQFTLGVYDCDFIATQTVVMAGNISSGSPNMTVTSTASLRSGWRVAGTGIVTNNTCITVTGATTVKLSSNATATNGTNKTFQVPAFSYEGVGLYTIGAESSDMLDMQGCNVIGETVLRSVHASSTRSRLFGNKYNGTFILRDDGTVPSAGATVTAVDSINGTVTVAPGSGFYAGGIGAQALNFVNYPSSFTNRSGDVTSGSTTISNVSSTAGLFDGMPIFGVGIPANTTITVTGQPANTLLLSQTATQTTNGLTLSFGVNIKVSSYTSYDNSTGVFSGVVADLGGFPVVGDRITTVFQSNARMEMCNHTRLIVQSTFSTYGVGFVKLDLLGGSWVSGQLVLDTINAFSLSDVAGLSTVSSTTLLNGAISDNLSYKSSATQMGYTPALNSNWPSVPKVVSSALDSLADDKYVKSNNTSGTPTLLSAGSTIALSPRVPHQLTYIKSTGGSVTINSLTPIAAGSRDGQTMTLVGTHDTDTVALDNTGNLYHPSGTLLLKDKQMAMYTWNATLSKWVLTWTNQAVNRNGDSVVANMTWNGTSTFDSSTEQCPVLVNPSGFVQTSDLQQWYDGSQSLVAQIFNSGEIQSAFSLKTLGWMKFGTTTVAALPTAAPANQGWSVYVTDETGGPCLAISDGTNWRRVYDNAIVS